MEEAYRNDRPAASRRFDSSIRKTDDFEAAIGVAKQLYRDGQEVVQIEPLERKRANEVIAASETRRVCRSRAP